MKKASLFFRLPALLAVFGFMLQGCLKDTTTRTYTMFTPVYKTTEDVRRNIKNNAPEQVKNPGKMFVLGSYIFLNEIDKGIHVIDNSNPSSPVNKYFINIPGNIDIAVKGNTLYADLFTDLVTIDISNPAAIQVKNYNEDVFAYRRYSNGFVADSSKIVVDWIRKDTTIKYDDTWNWRRGLYYSATALSSADRANFSAAKGISGSMARFTLMNDYLYTVTESTLNVFDISQPHDPIFRSGVPVGWSIETIYPFKSNLFIGSATGMFIYSTANPEQPERLSTFSHVRTCDPVIAEDDFAYVTLRSGTTCGGFTNQLDILDIQNLSSPSLIKSYQLTNPHGLSKDGDLLFICDGDAGLKVYDASSVHDLKLLQTITGIDSYDVITTNKVAIVVGKDGLYQYDYTSPSNLKLLSKINIIQN